MTFAVVKWRWRGPASALMLGAVIAGCAHPGQPMRQTLRVDTPACEGARCELRNDRGQWVVSRTPGNVEIVSSNSPLTVSCRAERALVRVTQPSLEPRPVSSGATAAGAAIGGATVAAAAAPMLATPYAPIAAIVIAIAALEGGAIGYTVDASQRAMLYPSDVVVPLQCPVTASGEEPQGPPMLGLSVRGFPEGQSDPAGAVIVTSVVAGGLAARAGLQPGDLVTLIDGQTFDGTLGFDVALRGARGPLTLTVRRATSTQVLTLEQGGRP
jgi:membrane-associated protease RseP (regulator of RpoE activity)